MNPNKAASHIPSPARPIAGCEYFSYGGAVLIPRLVNDGKGTVMYTNSITGDLHEVSFDTWHRLLRPAPSPASQEEKTNPEIEGKDDDICPWCMSDQRSVFLDVCGQKCDGAWHKQPHEFRWRWDSNLCSYCGEDHRPAPLPAPASVETDKDALISCLKGALETISNIPNQGWGGDYQEIDEARHIAKAALEATHAK